jgi:hypothetical protein
MLRSYDCTDRRTSTRETHPLTKLSEDEVRGSAARCEVEAMPHRKRIPRSFGAAPWTWGAAPDSIRILPEGPSTWLITIWEWALTGEGGSAALEQYKILSDLSEAYATKLYNGSIAARYWQSIDNPKHRPEAFAFIRLKSLPFVSDTLKLVSCFSKSEEDEVE